MDAVDLAHKRTAVRTDVFYWQDDELLKATDAAEILLVATAHFA